MIRGQGGQVAIVRLDVTELDQISVAREEVVKGFGEVDVLVANAGINHGTLFSDTSVEIADAVIVTNFHSVVRLVQCVLPSMMKSNAGTIAGISSLAGYRGLPLGSVYGSTKAAMTNFLESLRVELHGTNIKVLAIHPGFVHTPGIGSMDHPKPFAMTSDRAAILIADAIACSTSHYGFPWIMEHGLLRIARYCPNFLYNPILAQFKP